MHFHIKALRKALGICGIAYGELSGFPDALMAEGRAFIRSSTPFNSESVSELCRDKDAAYKALEGIATVPRTIGFLDPGGRHPELCIAKSVDEIVEATLDFLYPRVVKMNRGEGGKNVYIAKDESEMRSAIEKIFDKSSRDYDYIALVQEYIEPRAEYRVAVASGAPQFAYARGLFDPIQGAGLAKFAGCEQIARKLGISWGALDFIESKDGRLYFLEANTKPLYEGFVRKNGDEMLVGLYSSALRDIRWKTHTRGSIGSPSLSCAVPSRP